MLQPQDFVAAKCQIAPLPKNQPLFSIWWRSVTGGRSHISNVDAAKFCRSEVSDNASPKPVTFSTRSYFSRADKVVSLADVATVSVLQLQAFVAAKCQIASLPKIQSLFSIWLSTVTGGRSHNSNVGAAKFCRSKVTDNASLKTSHFSRPDECIGVPTVSVLQLQDFVAAKCQTMHLPKTSHFSRSDGRGHWWSQP